MNSPNRSLLEYLTKAQPIETPSTVSTLPYEPFLVRSALSLEYTVQRLEYSLSRDGKLRQWLKLCLLLFLYALIPLVLFTPVVGYVMSGVAGIAHSLMLIVWYALQCTVYAAAMGFVLLVLFSVFRILLR